MNTRFSSTALLGMLLSFSSLEAVSLTAQAGDYNGDGKTDLASYERDSGGWFIMTAKQQLLAFAEIWGFDSAIPVPGDYNGDGVSDLAVYDTESGAWFIKTLGSNKLILFAERWGDSSMIPVPGDFNGDGVSDLAVYQVDTGLWFIKTLGNVPLAFAESWGAPGMIPVAGDYNGDGKSDLAVYEPSTGAWFIRTLKGPLIAFAELWGGEDFHPTPGDYDGDGRDDLALYNPANGGWYIRTLGTNKLLAFAEIWGDENKVPAPGDYDGDGVSDLAVYDKETADWFIRNMANVPLVFGFNWGIPDETAPPQVFHQGRAEDLVGAALEDVIGVPGPGGGFIWKPHSESNGNLVILLPASLTDGIRACWIYNEDGELLETVPFDQDHHNGKREHYRASMHGRGYGQNVYVVSLNRQGNLIHWFIPNGASRVDY